MTAEPRTGFFLYLTIFYLTTEESPVSLDFRFLIWILVHQYMLSLSPIVTYEKLSPGELSLLLYHLTTIRFYVILVIDVLQ